MSEQPLDRQGEAHEALNSAVANFGQRVLSDPRMLGNVVTDLLPDLPRERSLLVTGAEADVAGELRQHVEEQHVSPDTAVQLAAGALSERRAIDPAASMWIATEYAQALGYPLRPGAQPPPSQFGTVPPDDAVSAAVPTMTALPNQMAPPSAGDQSGYPGAQGGYPGAQAPMGGQPPAPGWPAGSGTGPPAPPPKPRNRWPVIAAGGAAALVIAFIVAAFAGGLFNSSKPPPNPITHPATPTPGPSVAALTELLPSDTPIDDPASQCQPTTPPFIPVGLAANGALQCNNPPGLSGGAVAAYQFNSYADYQKSWTNFNNWWGFTHLTQGSSCPLTTTDPNMAGTTGWHDTLFPARPGQVLQCEWTGRGNTMNAPSYAWTYPTENAFVIAWGAPNSTFSALQNWWTTGGTGSLPSPTPATP